MWLSVDELTWMRQRWWVALLEILIQLHQVQRCQLSVVVIVFMLPGIVSFFLFPVHSQFTLPGTIHCSTKIQHKEPHVSSTSTGFHPDTPYSLTISGVAKEGKGWGRYALGNSSFSFFGWGATFVLLLWGWATFMVLERKGGTLGPLWLAITLATPLFPYAAYIRHPTNAPCTSVLRSRRIYIRNCNCTLPSAHNRARICVSVETVV